MNQINILKYEIISAQGNLSQTTQAIKNENINRSSKSASTLEGDIEVPYFLLETEIAEKQNEIYNVLRSVISKIIIDLDENQKKSTTIILGTCLADLYIAYNIQDFRNSKNLEYVSKKTSIDTYTKALAKEFGLNDFTMTISTACTSSANAILEARNFLNNSIFEYVIVLGAEIFSKMMNDGFSSMKLLSQDIQKPFDKNRDGLVLGEGVGAVLLSKKTSLWSLEGGFSNCNSINITSVSEDGNEYVDVMRAALDDANLTSNDITALKAHATGTYTNDLSEINAISQLYNKNLLFTALKPYVGHTLGACGVLELCIFMSAIDNNFIPKTINHTDSILDDYKPITEHKECSNGIFMLNYFGFGGNNTSLIIKKELS